MQLMFSLLQKSNLGGFRPWEMPGFDDNWPRSNGKNLLKQMDERSWRERRGKREGAVSRRMQGVVIDQWPEKRHLYG